MGDGCAGRRHSAASASRTIHGLLACVLGADPCAANRSSKMRRLEGPPIGSLQRLLRLQAMPLELGAPSGLGPYRFLLALCCETNLRRELGHEGIRFARRIFHSRDSSRLRRSGTCNAANKRWRKAACASQTECTRWMQVRRCKRDKTMGGRLHSPGAA